MQAVGNRLSYPPRPDCQSVSEYSNGEHLLSCARPASSWRDQASSGQKWPSSDSILGACAAINFNLPLNDFISRAEWLQWIGRLMDTNRPIECTRIDLLIRGQAAPVYYFGHVNLIIQSMDLVTQALHCFN